MILCLLSPLLFATTLSAQTRSIGPADPLPEAPLPQIENMNPKQAPCRAISRGYSAGVVLASTSMGLAIQIAGIQSPPSQNEPRRSGTLSSSVGQAELPPCPRPLIDPFARFVSGPGAAPLSPKRKGALAFNNVIDPFNAFTILATAAISVGADAHSPYGPGMKGFAKNVGVAYTQDISGQLFDTFLIPSLVHQDPRYYRMPHASIPRRVLNSITQVYWSRSDSGKGMPNCATFLGFAINAEIMNLYVPGIQTDSSATAQRYITGLASAPIDNFITEFLPDVASKIHVRVVLVQRIINQVARTEPSGAP